MLAKSLQQFKLMLETRGRVQYTKFFPILNSKHKWPYLNIPLFCQKFIFCLQKVCTSSNTHVTIVKSFDLLPQTSWARRTHGRDMAEASD